MPDDSSHPRRGQASDTAWLDKTQLSDGPPQSEPGLSGGARLTCVGGPATSREYPLPPGGEAIIGRAPENVVSLPDSSVSRRHALVRWREGSWLVSDLHSGHGTLLNGIRVDGEVALSVGDIITVGNSALKFIDPWQVPPHRFSEDTDLDRTQGSMGGVTETHTGAGRTQIVLDPSLLEEPSSTSGGEAPPAPPEGGPRKTASPAPPEGGPRKTASPAPPEGGPRRTASPAPPEGGPRKTASPAPPEGGPRKTASPAPPEGGPRKTASPAPPRSPSAQAPPASARPSTGFKKTTHLPSPASTHPASRGERPIPADDDAQHEESAPKGRRNLLLWGALIGSLCLIPILARATVNVMAERRARQAQEARQKLEEAFEQGKALMGSGQWEEAKVMLQRVQQMDPSYPVQDLIDRAEREQANSELLEAASAAVGRGQLERASEALLKVSTDTTLREEVARVRGRLAEKVAARLQEAKAAFRAKRYDEVLAITSEILKAFPEHRDARTLRDQVLILRARSGGKGP